MAQLDRHAGARFIVVERVGAAVARSAIDVELDQRGGIAMREADESAGPWWPGA